MGLYTNGIGADVGMYGDKLKSGIYYYDGKSEPKHMALLTPRKKFVNQRYARQGV